MKRQHIVRFDYSKGRVKCVSLSQQSIAPLEAQHLFRKRLRQRKYTPYRYRYKTMDPAVNRDAPIVPSDYVFAFTEGAKSIEYAVSPAFANAGIDYVQFVRAPFPLTINQVIKVVTFLYDALNMPYLGLATGQQMRLTAHGMAGVSAMAQPTYAECLKAAGHFCKKSFPALEMTYFETDDTVGLKISEATSLAPVFRYFVESIFVNFYNIFHFLMGEDSEPEYISFSYPRPSYHSIYSRYFKCKIIFDSKHSEFVVAKSSAQRELLLANQSVVQMAEKIFFASLPNPNFKYLPERLRLLLAQSVGALPSLDVAARKLGMSGRTLRRKLLDAGTNYQNELDSLRLEFAKNYLTKSTKRISEIALLLGYSDTSSFCVSFSRWTGQSPREFRNAHAVDQGHIVDDGD